MLNLKPWEILNNPLYNKGTAFTQEERDKLGLNGFLPVHISTIEDQVERRYANFQERPTQLAKYLFLSSLQNRNETLFYRLVYEHIPEMVPLIYTPTVGDVSLHFSILYRQHRGIYLSYPLKEKIGEILDHLPVKEIEVIVVTDGERILGLGDVGIGGMAISQGKLALYVLFGGIHPSKVLPIMLDVGTNNQSLIDDPLYLGWKNPRIRGKEYDAFIELFIQEVKKRFPKVLLQWEDFAKLNARPLLERYKNTICSFNDDIQGTAAVTLSAIMSAVKRAGTSLTEQKIVILGGGTAGLGIANFIVEAMVLAGCSEQEALANFYIVDMHGLVHDKLPDLDKEQQRFARNFEEIQHFSASDNISLLNVVLHAKPTILIGVSTQSKAFDEKVVTAMAENRERPIIFPLSNPTSKSEADPADLMRWTRGKAIIATGSPFPPVEYEGKSYPIAQCNNVYIFPGVGLGLVVSRCPKVTNKMFIKAAEVLSDYAPLLHDKERGVFPELTELRAVSRQIALGVWEVAQEEGLVAKISSKEMGKALDEHIWFPEYSTGL